MNIVKANSLNILPTGKKSEEIKKTDIADNDATDTILRA